MENKILDHHTMNGKAKRLKAPIGIYFLLVFRFNSIPDNEQMTSGAKYQKGWNVQYQIKAVPKKPMERSRYFCFFLFE